jgi:hypothetical protein
MARGCGPRKALKVNVIVLVLNEVVLGSRRGGSCDWGECDWGECDWGECGLGGVWFGGSVVWGEWLSGDGVGFWKGLCSGVCNCGAGGGSKLRDGGVWKRKNPGKREVFRGLGQGG